MARKLFISFLGTNAYKECTYYDKEKEYKPTPFIQVATLEQIGAENWSESDAIRIFVTDKANELNWDKNIKERKVHDDQIIPYHGLEKELDEMHFKANVQKVPIVDGKDEDEMWQIFQTVFNEIHEKDELYIDLTHAFRYLPMLVLVLSNYAKFLKHITIRHLSYGNWEARDTVSNHAPIVDLLSLTLLQDWTTAAADFLENGYAEGLKKAINKKLLPLLRNDALRTENVKNVNKLGANIDSFVQERITCRGMDIAKGTASNNLVKQLDKIEDTGIAPLNPIFHRLKESISTPSNESSRYIDAARWCYNMHLYQQAITILLEGINSFFCSKYGIKKDDEHRRDYVGRAFKIKSDELKPNGKKSEDCKIIDNVYMKSLLEDKLLNDADVVNNYTTLSGTRNDFNHSGFRSVRNPLSPAQIKQKISEALDFFGPLLVGQENYIPKKKDQKVFLNISNHPSAIWSKRQLNAALKFGEVIDMEFPDIKANAEKDDIVSLAKEILKNIKKNFPDADITVHVMGEMTFTYHLVSILKGCGVRCVASCSERIVEELGDGKRVSQFKFEKFREY